MLTLTATYQWHQRAGLVSKEGLDFALRVHQTAVDATKSLHREKAANEIVSVSVDRSHAASNCI